MINFYDIKINGSKAFNYRIEEIPDKYVPNNKKVVKKTFSFYTLVYWGIGIGLVYLYFVEHPF